MRVAIGHVPAIVADFFDNVLVPSAAMAGGARAFAVGLVGGLVARQVPSMIEQYLPMAKAIGLVDAENMINLDMAYEEAGKALKKAPLVVAGYRADQSDLDQIRDIARRYAQ